MLTDQEAIEFIFRDIWHRDKHDPLVQAMYDFFGWGVSQPYDLSLFLQLSPTNVDNLPNYVSTPLQYYHFQTLRLWLYFITCKQDELNGNLGLHNIHKLTAEQFRFFCQRTTHILSQFRSQVSSCPNVHPKVSPPVQQFASGIGETSGYTSAQIVDKVLSQPSQSESAVNMSDNNVVEESVSVCTLSSTCSDCPSLEDNNTSPNIASLGSITSSIPSAWDDNNCETSSVLSNWENVSVLDKTNSTDEHKLLLAPNPDCATFVAKFHGHLLPDTNRLPSIKSVSTIGESTVPPVILTVSKSTTSKVSVPIRKPIDPPGFVLSDLPTIGVISTNSNTVTTLVSLEPPVMTNIESDVSFSMSPIQVTPEKSPSLNSIADASSDLNSISLNLSPLPETDSDPMVQFTPPVRPIPEIVPSVPPMISMVVTPESKCHNELVHNNTASGASNNVLQYLNPYSVSSPMFYNQSSSVNTTNTASIWDSFGTTTTLLDTIGNMIDTVANTVLQVINESTTTNSTAVANNNTPEPPVLTKMDLSAPIETKTPVVMSMLSGEQTSINSDTPEMKHNKILSPNFISELIVPASFTSGLKQRKAPDPIISSLVPVASSYTSGLLNRKPPDPTSHNHQPVMASIASGLGYRKAPDPNIFCEEHY